MIAERVTIIGGGVIGLCSAYYALQRGIAVTVVDREPAGGDNCSLGNAGMIVPSHFIPLAAPGMLAKGLRWMLNPKSPFFVRPRLDRSLARWGWLFYRHATARHVEAHQELLRDLNLESRRLFAELASEREFGFTSRGLLMLCKSAKGLAEEAEVATAARAIGLKAEVLDAAATARRDPGVTMDVAGSVWFEQDCHLDPRQFMDAIRQRVIDAGGVIEYGVTIDQLEIRDGRVAAAAGSGRRFEGGAFVMACGSWSNQLLESIGIKLPLQAGKGYSLTLPKPPQLPQLCSIFAEAKVAITPMAASLRFAGTMEVGGLDLTINRSRVHGIIQSVPDYFPQFREADFADISPWAGLRPVTPDGIPYLGQIAGLDNLIAATGHAMMGLSLGPVSGRLVADLLAGDPPFRSLEAMNPVRFC